MLRRKSNQSTLYIKICSGVQIYAAIAGPWYVMTTHLMKHFETLLYCQTPYYL